MFVYCHQNFNRTNITKQCPGAQCLFAFYGGESLYHRYIFILQLCNLLVFLWLVNFIIALGQCTIAGAFASYYWAQKKPADIPPCPVFSSFARALRYSFSVPYPTNDLLKMCLNIHSPVLFIGITQGLLHLDHSF